MTFGPSSSLGPFLPINQTFSEDKEQFLIQITNLFSDTARYLNIRDIAIYDLNENPTGQQWYNSANVQLKRDGFRKVIIIGAIAAGATSTTAHGISSLIQITHRSCEVITAVPDFRSVPYASVTAVNQQIEIKIDATNITIINGAAAPNIASGIVYLEYLKN